MCTEYFPDKQHRTIKITLDLNCARAEAWHDDVLIGHIEWSVCSIGLDYQGEDIEGVLLTNIFLDKVPGYTNSGIGTRIIQMIMENTGMNVFVCRDNGMRRSDGAHPTGDAATFYNSLTKKGLAHWLQSDC